MKQRPILVALIGYMIGILWGLYFRFSMVLCYILILATYYIFRYFFRFQKKHKFKLFSFRRYCKYLKLIVDRKVIFIFMIFSIVSYKMVLFQNDKYDTLYQDGEMLEITGVVVSQKIEKPYYNLYQIKVLNVKSFRLYIQVSKSTKELEYGDKVKLQGEYKKPSQQRNYGGYDDGQYLKILRIGGRVKVQRIEIVAKRQLNVILQYANQVNLKVKKGMDTIFNKEKSAILKGVLLGETGDIQEEVKENFQIANISHILAISGMHINYMIVGMQVLLKNTMGKKKAKIVSIFILVFYTFITGFSPSIVRAVVMGGITLGGEVIYRKGDAWNSIAISLLGMLCYNPFLILNVGLQLSYLGTVGIILFQSSILKIFISKKAKGKIPIFEKIKEMIAVSLSAQIMIFPILLYHFNSIGAYFLITNLLVSFVIGPILILGFFCMILSFIFISSAKLLVVPLSIGLEFLYLISKFSELPFSKIYMPTPNWIAISLYWIGIFMGNQIFKIYSSSSLVATQKRVKNVIALFQFRFRQKKKNYLSLVVMILFVLIGSHFVTRDLKIYFVDVGQGDCTLLVTPQNKTILIDGGGTLTDFDVGKKTLLPYLLDRGFTQIDYVLISHFDQDHVRFHLIFITRNKNKKCCNRKAI